jgi:hypothetical protein
MRPAPMILVPLSDRRCSTSGVLVEALLLPASSL